MSTLEAVIRKPTPESKVGINFEVIANTPYIKTLTPGSLCAATEMDVGMEVISINKTNVTGMTPEEMRKLIGDTPSVVSFIVNTDVALLFKVDKKGSSINKLREVPPRMFVTGGIPISKWAMIYDKFVKDLFPKCAAHDAKDMEFCQQLQNYVGGQAVGGFVGLGGETRHEQKTLAMLFDTVTAANNATIVASNVLAFANALVIPHGLTAQLVMEEKKSKLTKGTFLAGGYVRESVALVPVGLSFSKMSSY